MASLLDSLDHSLAKLAEAERAYFHEHPPVPNLADQDVVDAWHIDMRERKRAWVAAMQHVCVRAEMLLPALRELEKLRPALEREPA